MKALKGVQSEMEFREVKGCFKLLRIKDFKEGHVIAKLDPHRMGRIGTRGWQRPLQSKNMGPRILKSIKCVRKASSSVSLG